MKTVTINIMDEDEDFGGIDIEVDETCIDPNEIRQKIASFLAHEEGISVSCQFS